MGGQCAKLTLIFGSTSIVRQRGATALGLWFWQDAGSGPAHLSASSSRSLRARAGAVGDRRLAQSKGRRGGYYKRGYAGPRSVRYCEEF